MKITSADFIRSATEKSHYPKDSFPQIAFIGRSNVGKSSLLNHLLTRKALAKVSKTPGKTRSINFFSVNKSFYFVDLPGYGFAKTSPEEMERWKTMIEEYLAESAHLRLLLILVDFRHSLQKSDRQMIEWANHASREFLVIGTKADQVPQSSLEKRAESLAAEISETVPGFTAERLIPVSINAATGKARLWKELNKKLR